jgi:hypothetical protein
MAANRQIPMLKELAFRSLASHSLFKITDVHAVVREEIMRQFLQAVIDDERNKVRQLLDKHPELLIIEPICTDPKEIFVIESQYTWQKFIAKKPAVIAAQRRQIEMLKVLLPYYDKLEQTETVKAAKAAALSAWKAYAIDKDAIIIPPEYTGIIDKLIFAFSTESFPDGKVSKATEIALSSLFNRLLPEKPVKLDDYLDVELLLLAAYQAYRDQFSTFNNWDQRDAFYIRVIVLIQSTLAPETAKIFCESLYDVVEALKKGEETALSMRAASLKLKDGESFYRTSRSSIEGLGFSFFSGIFGGGGRRCGADGWGGVERFSKLMSSKNNKLAELMQPYQREKEKSRCVVC